MAIVSVAVSAGLVGFLVTRVPLESVGEVLRGARPVPLVFAALLYLLTYLARAARLRVLAERATTARMYGIVAIHTALLRVMPFRLGELSYPILASRLAGEAAARSTIVMVHVRLLDLLVLVPTFIFSALVLAGGMAALGWAVPVLALVAFVVAVSVLWKLPTITKLLSAASLGGVLRPALDRLGSAADQWNGLEPRVIAWAIAWSFAAWGLLYGSMWCMVIACGIEIDYVTVLAAGGASLAASIMPVSVGTIGFLESGFAFGLTRVGAAAPPAIAAGLILQWGTLVVALVTALVAYLLLRSVGANQGSGLGS